MSMANLGRVGFVMQGVYHADREYKKLDCVYYRGQTYVARQNVPLGVGILNTDYWQLMAQAQQIVGAAEDVILVQDEKPVSDTNVIWIKNSTEEEQVPSRAKFEALEGIVGGIKSFDGTKREMQRKIGIVVISQEDYDLLEMKDSNTIYLITEGDD